MDLQDFFKNRGLSFQISDYNFCDQLNELFHMNKKIKICEKKSKFQLILKSHVITDKILDLFLERLLSFRFRLVLGEEFFCALVDKFLTCSFFNGSLLVIMVEIFSSESELLSDLILCSIFR